MSSELLDQCRLEAKRCRKAIAKGSPAAFWRERVKASIARLDDARAVLQVLLDELDYPPAKASAKSPQDDSLHQEQLDDARHDGADRKDD